MRKRRSLTAEEKRTMRQLLRFADISRDMERNRNDSAFVENGGKIVYVLDQNIFEMFMQPSARIKAVESFYSTALGGQTRTATRYEAQCALIASEYLVCGTLPGNRDGVVYMTEEHWRELVYRIDGMHNELRRRMGLPVQANLLSRRRDQYGKPVGPRDVIEAFRIKFQAMHALVDQTPNPEMSLRRMRHSALDKDLTEDLEALATREVSGAVMNRVSVTRTAAEILSTDLLAEPLDQLRRLLAPSVRNRIHRLQSRYPCTEIMEIEADSRRWLRRLNRQLGRPRQQFETHLPWGERSPRALKNDAKSIAYLRWVARTCIPAGQRLAFVTGDTLIFDTYRRWYADGRALPDEPFFMRRAAQYSPIFIPSDSGGDLSHEQFLPAGRHSIFDRMQGAIESTLIPLIFSTRKGGDADGVFAKRREQLALRSAELEDEDDKKAAQRAADLGERISPEWLKDQGGKLEDVVDLWRAAQRLSIGASHNLIASRLTDEQKQLAETVARGTAEEAARALSSYAQFVASSLLDESLVYSLVHAQEFLNKVPDRDGPSPPVKRLSVALDFENLKLGSEMWNRPEIVFARAACVALDLQDAHNAHHFATLALRADDAARARLAGEAIVGLEYELRYLTAVTARILLCTVESHLRRPTKGEDSIRSVRRGVALVKDIYAQAADAVHGVIRFHHSVMTKADGSWDSHHAVRYLRGLSERASLHLFTATSFGLIRSGRQGAGVGIHDTRDLLTIARGDLRLCAIFDDGKKRLEEESLIWAVRDQYAPNVAGYETLVLLIEGKKSYTPDQWPRRALEQLAAFQKRERNPHSLLAAELKTFSLIFPEKTRLQDVRAAPDFGKRHTKMRLPLDQVLLDRIYTKILHPPPDKTGHRIRAPKDRRDPPHDGKRPGGAS